MRAARTSLGFTLLEVLVAIAILGLGMTSILSAQAGLFASSSYSERVSLATGMVRCKASEIELKLAKEGYPLLDVKDEGVCCADEPTPGYTCKWKVEKVELPPPPLSTDLSSKMSSLMSGSGASSLGGIGAIASSGQAGGGVLDNNAGLSDLSKLLAGQSPLGAAGAPGIGTDPGAVPPLGATPPTSPTDSFGSTPFGATGFGNAVPGTTPLGATPPAGGGLLSPGSAMGGTSSLAPLVMGMVYPTLKPMLEASIRKLTVKVEWQQGAKTRDLEIVEFVANPQQGGIDPNAAQGLDGLSGVLNSLMPGGLPGGTGTPSK